MTAPHVKRARDRRIDFGVLLLGFALLLGGCRAEQPVAQLSADGPEYEADLPRYGLNLGGSGSWGAEHLRSNVLTNPGFEAVLDRTVLIVREVIGSRIVDDTTWLARPDGFWTGGRYDIRSGPAAGQGGRILDSRKRPDDYAEISLEAPPPGLQPGDAVILTHYADLRPAPGWWSKGRIASATDEIRPGSPGHQSLRLLAGSAEPVELLHYFDAIGDRAGKLLPVRGPWRLSFWARAREPNARLFVHLDRGGHTVFLDRDVPLGESWREHVIDFDAVDDGASGVLTLGLRASGGEVLLDDASLGARDTGVAGFRPEVVDTLRALRPGYLRDWQGQLGDQLRNRLAEDFAHQPVRYRPGDSEMQFHYGLPDFLALCAAIGAEPWIVAPTTLDDDEWRQLGASLREAADRHGFKALLVEFGNENWNPIFRAAGIPNPVTLAEVADRAFRLMRAGSANDPRLVPVVNAQFVMAEEAARLGALSREVARIAVAPYFLYGLERNSTLASANRAAFAESDQLIRQEAETALRQGKRLAVYEENYHTTFGDADLAVRNAAVTGAASGPALARRLLQGTLAGVREQAVYSFSGFDSYLDSGKSLVRLWGITRDLATAQRLRPTGLALQLLNSVAGGPASAVQCVGDPCPELTAVAFQSGQRLAIVSARQESTPLTLKCAAGKVRARFLDGSPAEANNEDSAQVAVRDERIACRDGHVEFSLQPYSLAVLDIETPKPVRNTGTIHSRAPSDGWPGRR